MLCWLPAAVRCLRATGRLLRQLSDSLLPLMFQHLRQSRLPPNCGWLTSTLFPRCNRSASPAKIRRFQGAKLRVSRVFKSIRTRTHLQPSLVLTVTRAHEGLCGGLTGFRYMAKEAWVAAFEKPKTSPAMFVAEDVATTVMGPYLKFGCVSVRQMYREVR